MQSATAQYLISLRAAGQSYGLERMLPFIAALGRPDANVPCVHVAGTNGKGSTCALLESMFRAAGYTTGMYTSPHLVHLTERVRINGAPLPWPAFETHVAKLRTVADTLASKEPELQPSFFEYMTALAFEAFAAENVDAAFIETGLGGELDATNVLENPALTIITHIGLDHCDILGSTHAEIASAKAGIIKPGVPCIAGVMPAAALEVIRKRAEALQAPLHVVTKGEVEALAAKLKKANIALGLPGAHQLNNAAVALKAVEVLGSLPGAGAAFNNLTGAGGEEAMAKGLANAQWPGRWQTIALEDGRTLVLDGAHNASAAQYTAQQMQAFAKELGHKPTLILGVCGEDRAEHLINALAPHAGSIVFTQPTQQVRATPPKTLLRMYQAAFSPQARVPAQCTPVEALFPAPGQCNVGEEHRSGKGPARGIVLAGSLYLVGEALGRVQPPANMGAPPQPHLQD